MKLTGAAILISRGMKVLQAAPAAYPYRSGKSAERQFGFALTLREVQNIADVPFRFQEKGRYRLPTRLFILMALAVFSTVSCCGGAGNSIPRESTLGGFRQERYYREEDAAEMLFSAHEGGAMVDVRGRFVTGATVCNLVKQKGWSKYAVCPSKGILSDETIAIIRKEL